MTARRPVVLIARRELAERVRSKAFRVSTVISLLVILAIAILPSVLRSDGDGTTTYRVGLTGDVPAGTEDALDAVAEQVGRVRLEVVDVEGSPRSALTADDLDAVLVDDRTVVVADELPTRLEAVVQTASAQVSLVGALSDAGVSSTEVASALDQRPLTVDAVDPPSKEEARRAGVAFFATVLLFGQIFGYGFYVASGVVEEKSSRVMEVLLSRVTPTQLLVGKIVGIGLLGLGQLVLFSVVGIVAGTVSGTFDVASEIVPVAPLVLGWFLIGYALYACLFAMGGALASRTEELQSTTGPITLVAMASYFGATFAGNDPGGTFARVVSLIPTAAPLLMPMRMATGEAAGWEVLLATGLVVAVIAVLVPVTARVHAGAALFTRGQLKLRAALARTDR